MTRLAFIGRDGQVSVVDGGRSRPVTFGHQAAVPWSRGGARPERCAWPTFSPDGERLAVIRVEGSDAPGPGRVEVHAVAGVEGEVVFAEPDAVPLHASWSPGGTHLSVICQVEDRLELWVAGSDGPAARLVEEGVPLFASWLGDGRRLVVHVGSDDQRPGRLVVRDPIGTEEDRVFPHPGGSFCTPHAVGGRVVSVTTRDGASAVLSTDEAGLGAHELWRGRGLVAVVPIPGDAAVAVAAADTRSGGAYGDVWRVPLDGSPSSRIAMGPVHAFVPVSSDAVAVARLEPARRLVAWTLHGGGGSLALGRVRPTADQAFHLQFFEQLSRSHPLSDGDLLLQGVIGDLGPEVIGLDLQEPGRIHSVGEGSYGVMAHEGMPPEFPCP